jgi:hypothetical protein
MSFSENPWIKSKIIDDLQIDSTAKAPEGVVLEGEIEEEIKPKPKLVKKQNPVKEIKNTLDVEILEKKPAKILDSTETTVIPEKKTIKAYKTLANLEEFWKFVNSFQWRDKSESTLGMQVIVPDKMNSIKLDSFMQFATPLITAIIVKITPFSKKPELVSKVAWHILARGQEFYNQLMMCPDFCTYLFEGEYMDFEALTKK